MRFALRAAFFRIASLATGLARRGLRHDDDTTTKRKRADGRQPFFHRVARPTHGCSLRHQAARVVAGSTSGAFDRA